MRIIKNNLQALSIIEVMVVLLILVTGIVGTYNVLGKAQNLEVGTKNKLQAISIAREGIEAMINIRDTNWIKFSADRENCWNVLNYNSDCVGAEISDNTSTDILAASYIVFQNTDTAWKLTPYNEENSQISKDNNGLYTHNGSVAVKPIFTREIKISYGNDGTEDSNDPIMNITSLVQWSDSSSKSPRKVELKTSLTNWER